MDHKSPRQRHLDALADVCRRHSDHIAAALRLTADLVEQRAMSADGLRAVLENAGMADVFARQLQLHRDAVTHYRRVAHAPFIPPAAKAARTVNGALVLTSGGGHHLPAAEGGKGAL